MSKIYVGNLPYRCSEEELENAFAPCGDVTDVKVIRDRETGRSKGFGFIEFNDNQGAKSAIETMNGKDFQGRPLKVSEARERKQRETSRWD